MMNKHGNNIWRKIYIKKKTLVSEKELSDIDFEGFKKALMHIKNVNNSDNNVYLTVGSLIETT